MRVKKQLLACEECFLFADNGEIPENRPDLEADIRAQLGEDISYLHPSWEEPVSFSWQACECCGSALGGTREKLIVLAE